MSLQLQQPLQKKNFIILNKTDEKKRKWKNTNFVAHELMRKKIISL